LQSLCEISLQTENLEDATMFFNLLLSMNADDDFAIAGLGWVELKRRQNNQRSEELLLKAIELAPNNSIYHQWY
jgi:tetratricopeptide (TPR) repeat protein